MTASNHFFQQNNPVQYELSFLQEFDEEMTESEDVCEILDAEKCPDCDEISFLHGACNICHYMEFPDFELPKNFWKHKKSPRERTYLKENFHFWHLEAYAVFLDAKKQKVSKIVTRLWKSSFVFHVRDYEYSLQEKDSPSSFQDFPLAFKIDIHPKNIAFQAGNLKSTRGRVYELLSPIVLNYQKEFLQHGSSFTMYKEILDFVDHFLMHYHQHH